ncbi:MAG TPA: glycosyltransferase [Pyrinomonadaceae bacterium]
MKRNVLELTPSFHQGGSERQCVQLTRLLHEGGRHRVRLAALDGTGPLRAEAESIGLGEVPSFPLTSFYDRNAAAQLRRFARLLREWQIDLVHAHDFYTNIFGMAGAALARVPVRIASRRESAVRSARQRLVERAAYRLADAVVANCEEVRRQLVAEGVAADKTVTIHNGLDLRRVELPADFDRRETLAALGLPAEEGLRFVTILANLRIELKDHPTFLRAASRVRAAVPEARFVLAGEGELASPLRALAAELGVGDSALFIGRCRRVAELLAVSDVCVLSSKAEGFSNSILEYMAAGRPVVATDVGGAREAVVEGETGHLVASGDDEALAARISALLGEPERARAMGARGRAVVEEKFSSAAQLERTLNLYERLLTEAHRGAARLLESVGREGA